MSAVVAAARELLGVRFRPHGRGCDGLDCIGLVAAALHGGGWAGEVPRGYRMRGGEQTAVADGLAAAGLRAVAVPAPGDVLLARAGMRQLHLGIWTGAGLVHADAALGRVVERPGAVPWDVVGWWRWEG